MITRLVVVSDKALPKREGSNSRLSIACDALAESFYCSLSFASSASALVFTAYLYSLIIRMRRINLRDLTTLIIFEEPPEE
jgi:hypothetical protein